MINIGINGLGRIGRAIFRIISNFQDVNVVHINDINPENENLIYLLKFDSYYGRFNYDLRSNGKGIYFGDRKITITHEKNIDDVKWEESGCDYIIESSGIHSNLERLPNIISKGVKKIIVTHSPEEVDKTIILGANEDDYDPESHNIVSSSICDAVAFVPVYNLINEAFGVEAGFLKTLHPWLSYQNLLDGPSTSWANPGTLYNHYAVGRASTASIIPKPTSAINAAEKVVPGVINKMKCYSFRIPTPVVGAADITFSLESEIKLNDLISVIDQFQKKQKWPIMYLNTEPLVSVDFTGTDYSAVIDNRWIELINGKFLNLTLWYDNEWGYSRRVVDVLRYISKLKSVMHISEKHTLS